MQYRSYPDELVKLASNLHTQLGALRSAPPQAVPALTLCGLPAPAASFPGWLFRDREVLYDALFDGIAYIDRHRFSLPVTEVSETFVDLVGEAFTDHRARVASDPLMVPLLGAGAFGGRMPDPTVTVRQAFATALSAVRGV